MSVRAGLFGGDGRSERQDRSPVLVPLVERSIAAPERRLTNRDGHEQLAAAPSDFDAVSAGLELGHFGQVNGQVIQLCALRTQGDSANADVANMFLSRTLTEINNAGLAA